MGHCCKILNKLSTRPGSRGASRLCNDRSVKRTNGRSNFLAFQQKIFATCFVISCCRSTTSVVAGIFPVRTTTMLYPMLSVFLHLMLAVFVHFVIEMLLLGMWMEPQMETRIDALCEKLGIKRRTQGNNSRKSLETKQSEILLAAVPLRSLLSVFHIFRMKITIRLIQATREPAKKWTPRTWMCISILKSMLALGIFCCLEIFVVTKVGKFVYAGRTVTVEKSSGRLIPHRTCLNPAQILETQTWEIVVPGKP